MSKAIAGTNLSDPGHLWRGGSQQSSLLTNNASQRSPGKTPCELGTPFLARWLAGWQAVTISTRGFRVREKWPRGGGVLRQRRGRRVCISSFGAGLRSAPFPWIYKNARGYPAPDCFRLDVLFASLSVRPGTGRPSAREGGRRKGDARAFILLGGYCVEEIWFDGSKQDEG